MRRRSHSAKRASLRGRPKRIAACEWPGDWFGTGSLRRLNGHRRQLPWTRSGRKLRSTRQAARPERRRRSHRGGHDKVTWGIPDAGFLSGHSTASIASGRTAAITRGRQEKWGGARAWALEPLWAATADASAACHTTRSAWRKGMESARAAANRSDALACARQHSAQAPACAVGEPFWSLGAALLADAVADDGGRQADRPRPGRPPRQAAIGASTCIAKASRTRGKNFCSRARIRRTIRSSAN